MVITVLKNPSTAFHTGFMLTFVAPVYNDYSTKK